MYADTKISEDATGSIRIEANDTQTSNLGATAEYKFVNPAGGSDLCNNKSSGSLDNSNSTVVLTESTGRTSDGKDFYRLTVKHR